MEREGDVLFVYLYLCLCVCLAQGSRGEQRKEKEGPQQVFGAIGVRSGTGSWNRHNAWWGGSSQEPESASQRGHRERSGQKQRGKLRQIFLQVLR